MDEVAGIFGLALLSLSWFSELYSTIRSGYAKVPFEFAVLYFMSSLLLAYHAYSLNDTIFIILNLITTVIAMINIFYLMFRKNPHEKEKPFKHVSLFKTKSKSKNKKKK